VCDRDAERARALGEELGVAWTTSVAEVAASDAVAVSVATPDHAHADPVITLLEAGKHVLVEKPLATSVAEAENMAKAAEAAGTIAMVDFQQRWNPAYLTMKSAIDSGELGRPVMAYNRLSDAIAVAENWLSWASRSGPQWFLFPHIMDITCWLIGQRPVSVYAAGSKKVLAEKGVDCWDAIQALVKFEDCFVTFETSWIVPDSAPSVVDCHMTLYGDKGKVDYDADYAGLQFATDKLSYPWAPVGQRDRYGKLNHYFYEPMRYFVDCVRGDAKPECTFEEGLLNVRMIDAVLRSLATGQVVEIT
jgi:predicted dehydrogenase